MAFPFLAALALAGTGLTAAGSVMNAVQQRNYAREVQRQQNAAELRAAKAREAERVRQRAIEQDNLEAVRENYVQEAPDQRAEKIADIVTAGETPVQEIAARYDPLPRATDVQGEVIGDAGKLRDEAARKKQMINALAILNAQGLDFSDTARSQEGMMRTLQNNASRSQRSLNAARAETSIPAARVQQPSGILGTLMQGLGTAATAGAGAGIGAGAGGTITLPNSVADFVGFNPFAYGNI